MFAERQTPLRDKSWDAVRRRVETAEPKLLRFSAGDRLGHPDLCQAFRFEVVEFDLVVVGATVDVPASCTFVS